MRTQGHQSFEREQGCKRRASYSGQDQEYLFRTFFRGYKDALAEAGIAHVMKESW